MDDVRPLQLFIAAASLLLLTGCGLLLAGAAMTAPESNLKNQQKLMDRQLGKTAYERANAPSWMGYR